MPHSIQLIALLILTASLAAVLFSRLNQLPIVGYVVAGILVGPHCLSFVQGEYEIRFAAELGVVLLLFVLGMELPLNSLRRSFGMALPVTLLLVLTSVGLSFLVGQFLERAFTESLVYGFAISLSSTAVGVKLLRQADFVQDGARQVALAALITQDLLFIPMIITINSFGGGPQTLVTMILQIALAVTATVLLIWFLSTRARIHLLFARWVEKHDELIPVAALAWCFVGAALSEKLGLSPAFGAFLAGLIIGNSHSKRKIFPKIEPMQSVLLMVFFVSIGMLMDLRLIWNSLGKVFLLVVAAMLLKSFFCVLYLRLFLRWRESLATGLALSQIGEFSFVLASGAVTLQIISVESYKLLVAVIAITLAISPLWTTVARRMVERFYLRDSETAIAS